MELKVCILLSWTAKIIYEFLIHRVELKGQKKICLLIFLFCVSNSPCGVESPGESEPLRGGKKVSNSPCGVESLIFLLGLTLICICVSNSPCGVESVSSLLLQINFY